MARIGHFTVVLSLLAFSILSTQAQDKPGWSDTDCAKLKKCMIENSAVQQPAHRTVHRKHMVKVVVQAPPPAVAPAPSTDDRLAAVLAQLQAQQAENQKMMTQVLGTFADSNKLNAEANKEKAIADTTIADATKEDAETRKTAQVSVSAIQALEADPKTGNLALEWYKAKTVRRDSTLRFVSSMFGDVTDPLGRWLGRTRVNITGLSSANAAGGSGGTASSTATGGNATSTSNSSSNSSATSSSSSSSTATNTNTNNNNNNNNTNNIGGSGGGDHCRSDGHDNRGPNGDDDGDGDCGDSGRDKNPPKRK